MKVTIDVSPESFEAANCILARAIEALDNNFANQQNIDIEQKHVERAKKFRKQLLIGFKKSAKGPAK